MYDILLVHKKGSLETDSKKIKQTIVMVKDEDEYQKLLEQARRELHVFKQKYSCLSELAEIIALID